MTDLDASFGMKCQILTQAMDIEGDTDSLKTAVFYRIAQRMTMTLTVCQQEGPEVATQILHGHGQAMQAPKGGQRVLRHGMVVHFGRISHVWHSPGQHRRPSGR